MRSRGISILLLLVVGRALPLCVCSKIKDSARKMSLKLVIQDQTPVESNLEDKTRLALAVAVGVYSR